MRRKQRALGLQGQALLDHIFSVCERQAPIAGQTIGCLIWQGPIDRNGYGKFSFGGKDTNVHRVVADLISAPSRATSLSATNATAGRAPSPPTC